MTIHVDELVIQPNAWGPFRQGSSHLTFSEPSTLEDLHIFASRIGLKRSWFQDHHVMPHYDLTATKRKAAMLAGAVFVPCRTQIRSRVRAKVLSSGARP